MRPGRERFFTALQDIHRDRVPGADFHMHTTWTDGTTGVQAMHAQAVSAGLTDILFSEHARKTSEDWFSRFAEEVRALPKDRCKAWVGVETKAEDWSGKLDCTDAILSQCDLVMASVHRFPGEKGVVQGFGDVRREEAVELEYKLASAILDNPQVDILGHPFGMCYRRYQATPPDDRMRALIRKAAKNRIAFEVNCHYHPEPWVLIDWCLEEKALFSLGSNAHAPEEVGRITRVLKGKELSWTPSA